MESLSIWSVAGVVLNSAVIMTVHGRSSKYTEGGGLWHTFNYDRSSKYTEGVGLWHTSNYDVTVLNGVHLCHPIWLRDTIVCASGTRRAQAASHRKPNGKDGNPSPCSYCGSILYSSSLCQQGNQHNLPPHLPCYSCRRR